MENGLKSGPITPDELMQRLAGAKKILTKVESGDYATGNINESDILTNDDENYEMADALLKGESVVHNTPINNSDIDKINQSKLPDNIKRAMIENPITKITLNDSLDMDFVEKTKRLMESDNGSSRSGIRNNQSKPKQITNFGNNSELVTILTPIIENIIRKSLDEIVDRKLNQILTAQQTASLNENLVIKVGDSIFKGKIIGVSQAK
jgi:hypothetical protein